MSAHRLDRHQPAISARRSDPKLVGRTWELNTIAAILDEAIGGAGCVIGVLGPPGIGKSRIVREAAAIADEPRCPGVHHLLRIPHQRHSLPCGDGPIARRRWVSTDSTPKLPGRSSASALPTRTPKICCLLDDLLGVADPDAEVPDIEGDARRRRLTALINAASMARSDPALYVIEDAHWIDEVSESMLADFLAVIRQTPSMVLITYRPEYRGALATIPGAQTIALRPLNTDADQGADR